MIKILLLKDKEKIEELCKNDGVGYNDETMCYCCDNNGEELGYCLFDNKTEYLQINSIYIKDIHDNGLYDGLIRSVLGYARENNINDVVFHDYMDENKLIAFGFIKDNSDKHIAVNDFLMKKC